MGGQTIHHNLGGLAEQIQECTILQPKRLKRFRNLDMDHRLLAA